MPLEDWHGEAKIIVGTITIIGEFSANSEQVGQTGLKLQMEPIAWLRGDAEMSFVTSEEMLHSISEQRLDRSAIERSQATIAQKYRHHPTRRNSS